MEAMAHPSVVDVLDVDDFVRRLISRGRELHWLAGAGVSLSAGVPTAADLIYDFKSILYSQAKRVPITHLEATDPDVRLRLDAYFADSDRLVPPDHRDEYAVLFEAVCPDRRSRQRKIEQVLADASPKPALGHLVFASMWQLGMLHVVWTTNFDDVLEQAANEVAGKPRWLTVADLDGPDKVRTVFTDTDRPVLVKMHGDFQSERLSNTTSELQDANNQLRRAMTEAMRTRGLVVVGYSGRDDSVMDALTDALDADHPFDGGLYWVARPSSRLLPSVEDLLRRAAAKGVDAFRVECASFEELMQGVRLLLKTDDDLDALFNRFQPKSRLSPFEQPPRGGRWPKIRLNAIGIAEYPKSARLVKCEIGGTREVRAVVSDADVDVLVARRRDGVIAFGADADLLTAFADHHPSLDYGQLDPFKTVGQGSADLGLLYDAVARALQRNRPLLNARRGRQHLLVVDGRQLGATQLTPLRTVVKGGMAGRIPGTSGRWAEAVEIRLEHRFNALWLIYTPTVWSEPADDINERSKRREWTRERQATRYNRIFTSLLKAWADVLCGGPEAEVHALGLTHGADARFFVKRVAPYVERIAT